MSVEQRPPDRPADAPLPRSDEPDRSGPHRITTDSRIHVDPPRSSDGSDLPDRIERARLRARIAALERSLTESERRRQAIIEQYERILSTRDEPEEEGDDVALVRRLWSVLVG